MGIWEPQHRSRKIHVEGKKKGSREHRKKMVTGSQSGRSLGNCNLAYRRFMFTVLWKAKAVLTYVF
jgi:hypothetical protein